jgi:hypothetical protein
VPLSDLLRELLPLAKLVVAAPAVAVVDGAPAGVGCTVVRITTIDLVAASVAITGIEGVGVPVSMASEAGNEPRWGGMIEDGRAVVEKEVLVKKRSEVVAFGMVVDVEKVRFE